LLALAVALPPALLLTPPRHIDAPLEALLRRVIAASGVPGGVVAWGRPAEAPKIRAVGIADLQTGRTMRADDRFRLASLTKPVVAAVLHRLAADGRLSLTAPLSLHTDAPAGITVAQAMAHLGGWDRAVTGDPFFMSDETLATRFAAAPPGSCLDLARLPELYTPQQPPGTTHAYSNLGYCWLGAVIEAATDAPWLDAARAEGGAALSLDQATITVTHAMSADDLALAVMRPDVIGPAGGLIADASTVLAFTLSHADARAEDATAAALERQGARDYYGLGWRVWRHDGATYYTHYGSMPGTFTFAIRRADGGAAVILLNGALGDPAQAARVLAADLMSIPHWQ
jgi:CubicO group peptidase (beta-lactamase class C family)